MGYFGQLLTRHAHEVGHIVKSRSGDEEAAGVGVFLGLDEEVTGLALGADDALVEVHVERFDLGDSPVVVERLFAKRFVAARDKGIPTDFQQVRRREKLHAGGVAEKGVDERAFLDHKSVESSPLGFDRAGEADGTGADDDNVPHESSGGVRGGTFNGRAKPPVSASRVLPVVRSLRTALLKKAAQKVRRLVGLDT